MRAVSIILLLGLCNSAFSQDIFSTQVKKILDDTTNYFSSLKGEFKSELKGSGYKDSVFYSRISLVGLKTTEYVKIGSFYSVRGLISDSVSKKKGKLISKRWKKKIRYVVGKNFTIKKDDGSKPVDHSWVFKHDNVEITIWLDRMLGEPNYPFFYIYFSIEIFNYGEFPKSIMEDSK